MSDTAVESTGMEFSEAPVESFDSSFEVDGNIEATDNLDWDNIPVGEDNDTETNIEESGNQPEDQSSEASGEESSEATEESSDEEGEPSEAPEGEAGDSKPEIELDALKGYEVPVMIDGQEVKVPVQELINNYSGKQAWDKRFNELSNARKEFETEMNEVDGYLNQFAEHFEKGDVYKAMEQFASFANVPSYEMKHRMMAAFKDEFVRIAQMGPEKYNEEYLRAENEYLKQKEVQGQEKQRSEQAQRELTQKIEAIQNQYGISGEEYEAASAFLQERLSQDKDLAEKFPLTPENIAGYVLRYNADLNTQSLLKEVDASLLDNNALIDTLTDISISNPQLSREDLKSMLVEQLQLAKKTQTSQRLVEKVEKKAVKQSTQKPSSGIKPLESWDDI